jgi:hypothetical protein
VGLRSNWLIRTLTPITRLTETDLAPRPRSFTPAELTAVVTSYERAYDECWAHHPELIEVPGSIPIPIESMPSSGHGKPEPNYVNRVYCPVRLF